MQNTHNITTPCKVFSWLHIPISLSFSIKVSYSRFSRVHVLNFNLIFSAIKLDRYSRFRIRDVLFTKFNVCLCLFVCLFVCLFLLYTSVRLLARDFNSEWLPGIAKNDVLIFLVSQHNQPVTHLVTSDIDHSITGLLLFVILYIDVDVEWCMQLQPSLNYSFNIWIFADAGGVDEQIIKKFSK